MTEKTATPEEWAKAEKAMRFAMEYHHKMHSAKASAILVRLSEVAAILGQDLGKPNLAAVAWVQGAIKDGPIPCRTVARELGGEVVDLGLEAAALARGEIPAYQASGDSQTLVLADMLSELATLAPLPANDGEAARRRGEIHVLAASLTQTDQMLMDKVMGALRDQTMPHDLKWSTVRESAEGLEREAKLSFFKLTLERDAAGVWRGAIQPTGEILQLKATSETEARRELIEACRTRLRQAEEDLRWLSEDQDEAANH